MSADKPITVAVDLTAGTAGGIAQIFVGHPFDTVKVQLQRSAGHPSPIFAARQILTTQGVRGLYRGVGPPLCTVAAFNAMLFGVTGSLNRIVRPQGGTLTPAEAALTGGIAGIPVSILATPTELLKCRMQAQAGARPPPGMVYTLADAKAGTLLYKGPLDALQLVLKFEGGVGGMFRGLGPTLAREVPGNAIYFAAYAFCKERFASFQGMSDTSTLGPLSLMTAGGIAGAAFWIPTIPIDTIKTRIQTDSPHRPKYSGIIDCGKKVVATEGWAGLFKGWQPCVIRSVPANAVTFLVYELALSALSK